MAAIRIAVWLSAFGMAVGCGRVSESSVTGGGGAGGSVRATADGGSGRPGTDGGVERPVDASLESPRLRLPQNGRATGSVWAERARRPRFVWDAQPGMTFEIEVDDSCEIGALETCDFSSPEWTAEDLSVNEITPPQGLPVSEQAPVGRRYYWRVRSCTSAACSMWSRVRYVDVGRQRSDFDGDGYADVVLSDEGNTAQHGRVLVGFGPAPSKRTVVLESAVPPQTPDHFGEVATPIGDMDADGFADLLVTAPGDQVKLPGNAHVFFGSATFSDATTSESLLVEGDGGDRLGGVAVAAGDVDADGMQDFVVDSYPTGPRLYRGHFRGVNATLISVTPSGESLFGMSSGDVTGDGYSDLLAVSVRLDGSYHARYDLLRGSSTGLADPADLVEADGLPVASRTITADVNGDGFSELGHAVSVPTDRRIDVSLGAETPLLDPVITWDGGIVDAGVPQYVELAGPIAAGDVNGDGFEDSLVGFSWHDSDLVQTNLYVGGQGSLSAPDMIYSFQTGLDLYVSAGVPSCPGDVNGDGFDDVVLSESFHHTGQLYLGGSKLDGLPDDHLELPPP